MMNVSGTTKSQVQDLIEYGDALELCTTIEGDATMAGASQLATFQLSADTIKTLLPAFQDLAVAQYGVNVSQEQMIQSGNLIGKVMNGSTGALTKAGVSFTEAQEKILKTGTESEKAAALVEVLNKNFGGLAQEMAKTDEGRIRQLKNAWGSVKDEVGFAVLPAVSEVVKYLSDHIPQIRSAVTTGMGAISSAFKVVWGVAKEVFGSMKLLIQENEGKFIYIANAAIPWLSRALKVAAWAASLFVKHWKIVVGIKGSISIFKKVTGIIGTVKKVIYKVKMAILDIGIATMSVSPVVIGVIAGIGLLVAAGIAVYKNWDTIKAKAAEVWGAISGFFGGIGSWFADKWSAVKTGAVECWSAVKSKASECWENVKAVSGTLLEAAKTNVSEKLTAIKAAYDNHGGGLKGAAYAAMEGVKQYYTLGFDFINNVTGGKLDGIKNKVISAFGAIRDKVAEVFNSIRDTVSGVWDKIRSLVKIPSISKTGSKKILGFEVPTFDITWNAAGGIFTKPTVLQTRAGLQGFGEAGAEAVLPLAQFWQNLQKFTFQAQKAAAVPAPPGNNVINIYVNGTGDPDTVAERIYTKVKDIIDNM